MEPNQTAPRMKVVDLAATLAANAAISNVEAARKALRRVFGLGEADGIWGGSTAAIDMGFAGHPESIDLIDWIAEGVAMEAAEKQRAGSPQVRLVRPQCEFGQNDAMAELIRRNMRTELIASIIHLRWATDRALADRNSNLRVAVSVIDYAGNGWLFPVTDDAIRLSAEAGHQELSRLLELAQRTGAVHLRLDEAADALPEAFGMQEFNWDEESVSANAPRLGRADSRGSARAPASEE